MPNSSHRTRRPTLFGSALLATVAPLLVLGALATLIVGWFVGDHLTDTIALSAHAEADRQTDRLGRYLEARQRLLEVLARSPVLRSGDVEASLAYLASEAKALDGLYEGLYLNQLDGTVRGANGVTFSVVDRAYWPRVLRGEVVKSELITSRATGRRVALFVVPIQQDGRLIAALGGTALLESTLIDIADSAALLGLAGGAAHDCTNARDAMPSGGHITLATALEAASDSPGKLRLSVSDQGEGIAQEILPHIFEPFFSTKGVGRGTGLGLATCFGIVTRAGGNIAVESFEGGGTTFTLHLPRSFKAVALRPRDGGRTPVRRRVMLVEDAPLVRETTRLLLERAGHTVTAFDCARAAREAQLGTFDVLLTDLRMPGESGASFASYALTHHPDLKVVLMSGYFDAEDLTALSADPRVSLIPKPLQSSTLLDLIGRA